MKWLIDAGHGGVALGVYMTAGKRSPEVPPGILEGQFNRRVARLLLAPNVIQLNPGPHDIPVGTRVKTVNAIAAGAGEPVALISIHANASGYGNRWTDAQGFRVFHSRWASRESKLMADLMHKAFVESEKIPPSNRDPLGRNYTILWRTKCPSILIECGFMTSLRDVKYLSVPSHVAAAIAGGMRKIERVMYR